MALNFDGPMCGKCRNCDLSDKASYLISTTGFKCKEGEGYQAWDSKPCSRYDEDSSDSRVKAIYDALD